MPRPRARSRPAGAGGGERPTDARKRLYAEFQRIVVSDAPVAFTHVWPQGFATRRGIVDVPSSIWWPMTPYDTIRRQR